MWFRKWSRKANVSNATLLKSVSDLEEGLSTASLDGNLFKVRVKREGSGKSGSYRTIAVFREDDRAIFLYGFGKSERGNIDMNELKLFKKLGRDLLALDSNQLLKALKDEVLFDLEDEE